VKGERAKDNKKSEGENAKVNIKTETSKAKGRCPKRSKFWRKVKDETQNF